MKRSKRVLQLLARKINLGKRRGEERRKFKKLGKSPWK
jgi:hypothetical protein